MPTTRKAPAIVFAIVVLAFIVLVLTGISVAQFIIGVVLLAIGALIVFYPRKAGHRA